MIYLRPYQSKVKTGVYNAWFSGIRNVLAVLPTGAGKSILVSDIILDGVNQGMQQAVIAHRNELVAQMSIHLANREIQHRIIGSKDAVNRIVRMHRKKFKRSFINHTARTAVVSVDTLVARADSLKEWALQTDRWVTDEAHHLLRLNKWGKAVALFPHAQGLGVTASPSRPDGMGLGAHADGVFHEMIVGVEMRQLIDEGALTDYDIACPESIVMTDDDIGESGEFRPSRVTEKAEKSQITGDVVNNYIKHALGKRAICFATDVKTGNKIAEKFNAVGIRSACLSAKTSPDVREKYLDEFRDGKLLVLVNVDLFDEGFDVPACEVVIMARPTASVVKYLQMFGRALRTAEGKLYALIIDHVGNVKRHGLPDKKRYWTLDRRDKRAKSLPDPEDIELTVCKACSKPYERVLCVCPHCGATPVLPAPRDRSIKMVDGDLILLDREILARMRAATQLESAAAVGGRAGYVAGNFAGRGAANKQLEKIAAQRRLSDAIAQWGAIQRVKNRDDSQSYRRFYLTTGVTVLDALSAQNSRDDYEKMAEMVEGWYK